VIARAGSGRARARAAALACALALLAGCRTPSAPPASAPIEPLATRPAIMPSDGDLAAADLAAAVLVSDRVAAIEELARLSTYEQGLGPDEAPTGLPGYGRWAVNATLDDPVLFRRSMAALLEDDSIDPGLRKLVEEYRNDDPLRLARARVRDAWVRHMGTVFNQFAAPLGKSAASGAVAFVGLARSLFRVLLYELQREAMDLPERQALEHRKRFLEQSPAAAEAPEIAARIEADQQRWNTLQRDRSLQAGRKALEDGQPRVALVMAERALQYREEDPDATRLRDEAIAGVRRWRAARDATERAPDPGTDVVPEGTKALAVTLLADEDPAPLARALLASDPGGPLADEAHFILASAEGEAGDPDGMWEYLAALATGDPAERNMVRHAEAAVLSSEQNPYRAFAMSRYLDRKDQAFWVLFGPLAQGPQDRGLPRPVEWMVDLPTYVELFTSLPNRLVFFPWMKPWPFGKAPAVFGRRYLELHPEGAHRAEVIEWIRDWEERRSNHVGALEVARLHPEARADDLQELEEKAAAQMLEAAGREKRSDARLSILKGIARQHPGTKAGREAGEQARELAQTLTPQRVRVSRGFLVEHPHLAGPDGIGLEPVYLDGDVRNGELHPDGVALVDDLTLELSFVAESGKEKDPPERRYRAISPERMARLVALLDETSLRLAQLERDYRHESDAGRDRFFEHARLGVSAGPDPSAGGDYAFRGMRETYGLVRSRESILPFDLVVQGSLYDFGFGVFPRIRMPKPTPDAFLYR
jgi:hypothetical protein